MSEAESSCHALLEAVLPSMERYQAEHSWIWEFQYVPLSCVKPPFSLGTANICR